MKKSALAKLAFQDEKATRKHNDDPVDKMRCPFQLDNERVIRSKAFRRLKHKTQLFLTPRQELFRTRMTHTLESIQIARSIAEYLGLNSNLAQAIALSHDLGHTPFGHAGERALNRYLKKASNNEKEFNHNVQSVRIVTRLEKLTGKPFDGLNLTEQVIHGITSRNPNSNPRPQTQEALVAGYADTIAYVNHDFEDLVHSGLLHHDSVSGEYSKALQKMGRSHEERVSTWIEDILNASTKAGKVTMSNGVRQDTEKIRTMLYGKEGILKTAFPISVKDREAEHIITLLTDFYYKEELGVIGRYLEPGEKEILMEKLEGEDRLQVVADHIAGMTDTYAYEKYELIFSPKVIQYKF